MQQIANNLSNEDSLLVLHIHEDTITELMSASTIDHVNSFIARLEIVKHRVIRESENNMLKRENFQETKDVRRGVS
jgi:hypothetical protein